MASLNLFTWTSGDDTAIVVGDGWSLNEENVVDTLPGNDSIEGEWFSNYASLYMGEGDDSIRVVGSDINNYGFIEMGTGDDSISASGNGYLYNRSGSLIEMGTGDDSIDVFNLYNYLASIDMGADDDSISVDYLGNYLASIDMGAGDDSIISQYLNNYPTYPYAPASSIDMGAGDDFISAYYIYNAYGYAQPGSNGYGSIDMGAGDDWLVSTGDGIYGGRVDTGSGDDTVEVSNLRGGAELYLQDGDDLLVYDFSYLGTGYPAFYGSADGGIGEDTAILPGELTDYEISYGISGAEVSFTKDGLTLHTTSFEIFNVGGEEYGLGDGVLGPLNSTV